MCIYYYNNQSAVFKGARTGTSANQVSLSMSVFGAPVSIPFMYPPALRVLLAQHSLPITETSTACRWHCGFPSQDPMGSWYSSADVKLTGKSDDRKDPVNSMVRPFGDGGAGIPLASHPHRLSVGAHLPLCECGFVCFILRSVFRLVSTSGWLALELPFTTYRDPGCTR